jgi:GNAT superfamily N-acetyltransferase
VLKEFHGKHVGQLLYEKAIQIARQKNANYIWLGVWEETRGPSIFIRKMASWNSTSTFSD